jgi:hypothetical protein
LNIKKWFTNQDKDGRWYPQKYFVFFDIPITLNFVCALGPHKDYESALEYAELRNKLVEMQKNFYETLKMLQINEHR